ncbi:MAG: 1,4-dihydroxy-2-naphthoate polyprenyltransferase [Deltaproteobacteria bacterium]|nr:1,4-dihydroxy-2-naphthoate polyprenyltransferase [Deltaproteobacteria bacterium]
MTKIKPHSLKAWILASRPKTLPVGAAPIIAGGTLGYITGSFNQTAFFFSLLTALLLQIISNLANDLFDFKKGADKNRKGPLRVTASGLVSEKNMTVAIVLFTLLALLSGSFLVYIGGIAFAILGLFAVLSAIAYTAGPYPLGYNGLGDIFVLIFFGPVAVSGTQYLTSGTITFIAIPVSISIGLLAANVLAVNNIRDLNEDIISGKKTLVVRFGLKEGYYQFVFSLLIAYGTPVFLSFHLKSIYPLLPLALVILSFNHAKKLLRAKTATQYNILLAKNSLMTVIYAIITSISLILATLP